MFHNIMFQCGTRNRILQCYKIQFNNTYISKLGPATRWYKAKYPNGKYRKYCPTLPKMPPSFEGVTNSDVPVSKKNNKLGNVRKFNRMLTDRY